MTNKRPNKDTCIELILSEMDKGTSKNIVLAKFGKKWRYPEDTFDKHWLEAKELYLERRKEINDAKMEAIKEMEVEAVKRNILSKLDALEILTEIATNQIISDKGISNDSDRINAIKTINQMQGYNAPKESKLEIEQNDPFIIELSNEESDTD